MIIETALNDLITALILLLIGCGGLVIAEKSKEYANAGWMSLSSFCWWMTLLIFAGVFLGWAIFLSYLFPPLNNMAAPLVILSLIAAYAATARFSQMRFPPAPA